MMLMMAPLMSWARWGGKGELSVTCRFIEFYYYFLSPVEIRQKPSWLPGTECF